MSDEGKSFIVYDDIEAVLDELDDDQVGALFRGMVNYHITGNEPEFDGVLKFVFIPIKQGMDRNAEKYRRKCEKNRANVRKRYEQKDGDDTNVYDRIRTYTNATNNNSNNNNNTNSNSKSNSNNESTPVDVWVLSRSVLSHLNDRAGTHYRTDAADSVRLISELHHKGYTAEQMIAVIDKKAAAWLGDPKVEQYLRPSTLFGPRFEQYLNEPDTARKKAEAEQKDRERTREKARSDIGTYEAQLKQLRDQYEAETEVRRRIDIKGDIAIIEAKLEAARAVIS